jgi:hypothetical protein
MIATAPGTGGSVAKSLCVARVYVIELGRSAGRRRDPRIPWVYVGSSAREAEIRFAQHRRGYRSSRLVKRFALRLRPDLYEDLPAYPGAREAREAELARAIELAECGFVAHCDGTSHGKGRGPGTEWGPERLARVGRHADAAIAELTAAAFEPLDSERCAALLHGERGFWVGEHIDPTDPPPAYGQFAHVALEALRQRAEMAAMPSPAG